MLDALRHGDTNGDGVIELHEIVDHVQKVVPGIAHGLARAVSSAEPVWGVQTPRFGPAGRGFRGGGDAAIRQMLRSRMRMTARSRPA